MLNNCPECGSKNIKSLDFKGEIICQSCGLVIEDSDFEINPFIASNVQSRATLPFLLKAGTEAKNGRIFKNLWLYSTNQKNTIKGIEDIEIIAEKLNLPLIVVNEAKKLFKELMDKNYSWGRGLNHLSYSCVYLACSIFNLPKTASEISLYAKTNKKMIMKSARQIAKEFNIKIENIDPLDLVSRFGSNLDLSQTTLNIATEIIIKIKENNLLPSRRPESIVGVALYLASNKNGEKRTQRDITNNTGVNEVTLRGNIKLVKIKIKN
jgi:transcription initiation factor TFIIB